MKLLHLISQVVEFNCVFGLPTQTVAMQIYCKTFPGARREQREMVADTASLPLCIKTTDVYITSIHTGYCPIDFNHWAVISLCISCGRLCLRQVLQSEVTKRNVKLTTEFILHSCVISRFVFVQTYHSGCNCYSISCSCIWKTYA